MRRIAEYRRVGAAQLEDQAGEFFRGAIEEERPPLGILLQQVFSHYHLGVEQRALCDLPARLGVP